MTEGKIVKAQDYFTGVYGEYCVTSMIDQCREAGDENVANLIQEMLDHIKERDRIDAEARERRAKSIQGLIDRKREAVARALQSTHRA